MLKEICTFFELPFKSRDSKAFVMSKIKEMTHECLGFHLKPATAGARAAASHRVTGYLAMFVSKYFKNITLKMFTAYPFFS